MQFAELIETFSQKSLPHSEVELSGDVPYEAIAPYRERALKEIASGLELPGFRKGFVSPEVALKKVGDMSVLHEAAELFIRDFYPELVLGKKIDAVSQPNISITKLAPNNPISFSIRTAVYPTIQLPKNWKEIAQQVPREVAEEATEKEINETLESLRQSRKQGDAVPELDDAFARSVGAFADMVELKTKLTEGIGEEKKRKVAEKRRGAIIDALLGKTSVDMPPIFVESELEKILAQLKDDIVRFQISFEEYLKRVGKTEAGLREEYRAQAEKRAKLQLVLNTLAEQEKIEVGETAIEEEMKHALEHFPSAKPELLRIHIQTVLRNEKILQMLEYRGKKE